MQGFSNLSGVVRMQTPRPRPRLSYSEGLGWGPRIPLYNPFSGVEAHGSQTWLLLPSFVNDLLASPGKWRLQEDQLQKVMSMKDISHIGN